MATAIWTIQNHEYKVYFAMSQTGYLLIITQIMIGNPYPPHPFPFSSQTHTHTHTKNSCKLRMFFNNIGSATVRSFFSAIQVVRLREKKNYETSEIYEMMCPSLRPPPPPKHTYTHLHTQSLFQETRVNTRSFLTSGTRQCPEAVDSITTLS